MQLLLFHGFWKLWCWYFTQLQVDIVTSWTVQLALKKWYKFRLLGNFINIIKVELRVWWRIFCGCKKFLCDLLMLLKYAFILIKPVCFMKKQKITLKASRIANVFSGQ